MKIFDCFMYFNEDLILEIRLNELCKNVEKFIIVESNYTHSGEFKEYNFDIKKFDKFKDKITYIKIKEKPKEYLEVGKNLTKGEKKNIQILNALILENFQRNQILKGLNEAGDDDFIIVSDLDEIPNLKKVDLNQHKSEIIVFKQVFFHYRLNLYLKELPWFGSKCCTKKLLKSPQWLRNIKSKKYNFLRIDTLFSEKKYQNIYIVEDGGWHFTTINNEEGIIYKLKSYLHHADTPDDLLNKGIFEGLIKERKFLFDHNVDKGGDKYANKKDLSIFDFDLLPNYIKNNKDLFKDWIV
jgi:beta-1,4-mannosyl-glycoprotein beta-1,4-N-acetylglucosaminyltransferase